MANAHGSAGLCPPPFKQETTFSNGGFVAGRLCQRIAPNVNCCLPCPMTDWAYPEGFKSLSLAAEWVSVVSAICCVFLLASWAVLPVEKTHRHYLSICLTVAVMFMNLGFVIPLAASPKQCYDDITPNSMHTSSVCAASGSLLILGGWGGVLWVCLRSLSLHLQICWQVVVGRNFMWFSNAAGWGIPAIGITIALVFSGVSFRFGSTCHINHDNSLADLWIPLLVFSGLTIIVQFATFCYCIRVYLASLSDTAASTEGSSGLPYSNSVRQTLSPRHAYKRVSRVIQLQWRGIVIVLIITVDVIFFSLVFVFMDNTVEAVKKDPQKAETWIGCLMLNPDDKSACVKDAGSLVVNMPTIGAVLILLSMNGLWLVLLHGRLSMLTGWRDLVLKGPQRDKREFVSADARLDDVKKDTRSYEMLSRDSGKTVDDVVTPSVVTPLSPVAARSPMRSPGAAAATATSEFSFPKGDDDGYHKHHMYGNSAATMATTTTVVGGGRRTPDYFGHTVRYHTPARSFSSPRPPQSAGWDAEASFARPTRYVSPGPPGDDARNPLGMNRL